MTERDVHRAEARRIASQPLNDKLDGKQGQEAHDVAVRLLETAGLDYAEALHLLAAFGWKSWSDGWTAGYDSGRERFESA